MRRLRRSGAAATFALAAALLACAVAAAPRRGHSVLDAAENGHAVLDAAESGGRALPTHIAVHSDKPVVAYAAAELATLLGEACPSLRFTTGAPTKGAAAIVVGVGAATKLGLSLDMLPDDHPEATLVDTEALAASGSVLVVGGSGRGTLYAVYELLESLGFRFLSHDETVVPASCPTLPVLRAKTSRPAFEYRDNNEVQVHDHPEWATRVRYNGDTSNQTRSLGGHIGYLTPPGFVHTSLNLLAYPDVMEGDARDDAPSAVYAEHPEWFSAPSHGQLCWSDRALVARLKQQVRRILADKLEHPKEARILSVSQMDNGNMCETAAEREANGRAGSQIGAMLGAVNEIADDVASDFPNVIIDTLAYQWSRAPPTSGLRPRPNVAIRLAPIEADLGHTIEGSAHNAALRADLERWRRLSNRTFVWDYTVNFDGYFVPYPNEHVLVPNLRLYKASGVAGAFEEGDYNGGGGGDLVELKDYLLAKALWDVDIDVEATIDEFLQGYYGQHGAPAVREYMRLMRQGVDEVDYFLPYAFNGDTKGGEVPFLRAELLLPAASAIVNASARSEVPKHVQRLERTSMALMYVSLFQWDELRAALPRVGLPWPWADDKAEVLRRFAELHELNHVALLNEHATPKMDIDWMQEQLAVRLDRRRVREASKHDASTKSKARRKRARARVRGTAALLSVHREEAARAGMEAAMHESGVAAPLELPRRLPSLQHRRHTVHPDTGYVSLGAPPGKR